MSKRSLDRTALSFAMSRTVTAADFVDATDQARFEEQGLEVVKPFTGSPAFLGVVASTSGGRSHTLAAWTGPDEALAAIHAGVAHRNAVRRVLEADLGGGGWTSIWVPYRINDQLPLCSCGSKARVPVGAPSAMCACGATVAATSYI
jgi:hypothetical protein